MYHADCEAPNIIIEMNECAFNEPVVILVFPVTANSTMVGAHDILCLSVCLDRSGSMMRSNESTIV